MSNDRPAAQGSPLPPQTVLEIAAIHTRAQLEERAAAARAGLEALSAEDEKLAAAISAARGEVDIARQKVEKYEQKLRLKEQALAGLEAKREQIEAQREEKRLELQAIDERGMQLEARRIFAALRASGKSLDELFAFLGAEGLPQDPDEEAGPAAPAPEQPEHEQPKTKRPRARAALTPEQSAGFEALWQQIVSAQGQQFFTARGLPFCYEVRGKQLFIDRKGKPVSQSSLKMAYVRAKTEPVDGPKSLKTFGAPYVWGIFVGLGLVEAKKAPPSKSTTGNND